MRIGRLETFTRRCGPVSRDFLPKFSTEDSPHERTFWAWWLGFEFVASLGRKARHIVAE